MQIVYLSARPDVFVETLQHVATMMPFVDDVVVCVPASMRQRFAAGGTGDTGLPLTIVDDESLVPGVDLGSLNHSQRNFKLRAHLIGGVDASTRIADSFIMSDDDARPLRPLTPETFVGADGHHRSFYFYELSHWRRGDTSFDDSQLHSFLVLQHLGITKPLSYASHMPQIIDRTLYQQVTEAVDASAARYALCEWSIYGNLGRRLSPDTFAEPEPYATLAWPQYPSEWPRQVIPDRYLFENFHPELYAENGLFAGLDTTLTSIEQADTDALEKVVRWHRMERSVNQLDFSDDINNPWIKNSPVRKAAFGAARAAKKLIDYTNLDDQSTLAELSERVRRVEAQLDADGPAHS